MRKDRPPRAALGILIAALVAATVSPTAGPAFAHEAEKFDQVAPLHADQVAPLQVGETGPVIEHHVDDATALLEDQAWLAEQTGTSVEQIAASQRGIEDFTVAVEQIQEKYPDSYSNAVFRRDDYPTPWVGFKDEAPAEARALLEALPINVEIRENYGLSSEERSTVQRAVSEVMSSHRDCGAVAYTIDLETPTVKVTTDCAVSEKDEREMADAAKRSGEELQASQPVTAVLEVVDEKPFGLQLVSGGTALGLGATTDLECTAGFTVLNTNGGRGVMTASHCRDNLNYESRQILTYRGHMDAAEVDVQWHSTNEQVRNAFLYLRDPAGAHVRFVNGVESSVIGKDICMHGMAMNKQCSFIYDNDIALHSPTTGMYYSHMWSTTTYVTLGGDSGAPWYRGNKAIGAHSGYVTQEYEPRSVYGSVPRIQSYSDLRVLTSP